MKIYAINLPQCRDRRENILRECARFNLEAEIFPGVDGGALAEERRRELVYLPNANPLSSGEIGCTLSHLAIYRDMAEKSVPIAMILEDDSVFNLDPRPILDELERRRPEDADAYFLTQWGNIQLQRIQPTLIGGTRFYAGWRAFGAYGYLITRRAAENIMRFQTPVKVVCDHWKTFALHELVNLHICEQEFVGRHERLAKESLLEKDRHRDGREQRKYFKRIWKMAPLRRRVGYLARKLWHWRDTCG